MNSPEDSIDSRYERLNLQLAALFVALHAFIYFVLPLLLHHDNPSWSLALVPFVLLTTTFWALIHECFHGSFSQRQVINERIGRALSILFGCQYRMLRFGHLMHHRFNRSELDRSEIIARGPLVPGATLRYYYWLLGGLYLYELYSNAVAWLPRPLLERIAVRSLPDLPDGSPGMLPAARKQLLRDAPLRELRIDGLVTLLLLGSSLWLYGSLWWLLLLALLCRGMLVSLVDNSFHYRTPLDMPRYSWNLGLPSLLSASILYFNHHRIHHHAPGLPWWRLRERYLQLGDSADLSMLRAVFRQLKGPIPIDAFSPDQHIDQRALIPATE